MATSFNVIYVIYYIKVGGGILISIITSLIIFYKYSMTSKLAYVKILYIIIVKIVLSIK